MIRKSFLVFCLAGCVALPLLASNEKPLTIVVPTAAGGGNDAMARTIGQKLGVLLNRSVIVENKAGANGALASEFVAKAVPDGNTLMFGYIATHAMNPALQKLRYDPVRDFEPVGLVGYSPTLMVVNPSLKVKDVKDLVRVLKEKPDQYSSAPAVNDTIGGQTHVMFPSLFTGVPFVKSGRLQALAIAGNKRSAVLPDVPTLKEMGVDGVEVDQWYAIFAPAKTPKDVVSKLNQALNKVLNDPEIIKKIEGHGADVETSTPEQLGEMVRKDLVKWRQVVQRAKLQAD